MVERKLRVRSKIVIFLLLLFLLVIALLFLLKGKKDPLESDGSVSQSDLGLIEFEGQKYHYNADLFNLLFIGIDNDEELREHDIPGEAGQADSIMLFSMNKKTKECRIIQIPRDTMTEIDLYDGNGNRYDTVRRQLALQYAYGSGGENSCWAMKKTVSELLYELPIDAYLALDIAGVAIVNDAVGGVEITIPRDYTMIDPAFEENAVVQLTGEQAHSYVRYRDTDVSFSNQDRMERQLQYLPVLISTVKANVDLEDEFYDVLYPLVSKYMFTNLREDQVSTFAEFQLDEAEMEFLPGEWKDGENHDEYHVNDKELKKNIVETFYILNE